MSLCTNNPHLTNIIFNSTEVIAKELCDDGEIVRLAAFDLQIDQSY